MHGSLPPDTCVEQRVNQRWREDAFTELCRLVGEGHSGGEIAELLGISRNAVMGKIHRAQRKGSEIKLARADKEAREGKKRERRPRGRGLRMVDQRAAQQFKVVKFRPIKADVDPSLDITFIERERWQCSWIVDKRRDGQALCCGHKVWAKTSWCPGHLKVIERIDPRRAA
jgi:hypothetical protein